ncbi:MAG TPA: diguanylate cyclase [Burkholderiaceae bacterium]|nr:diguanylate cyclase [Burkholderiaceae bacterium]
MPNLSASAAGAQPAASRAGNEPANLAREAIRLLASRRLPPTPENFGSAYREIAGADPDTAPERVLLSCVQALAGLRDNPAEAKQLERAAASRDWGRVLSLVRSSGKREPGGLRLGEVFVDLLRQVDHPARGWTPARKKESALRVLEASGSDPARLTERLAGLLRSWSGSAEADRIETVDDDLASPKTADMAASHRTPGLPAEDEPPPAQSAADMSSADIATRWAALSAELAEALADSVPADAPEAERLRAPLLVAAGGRLSDVRDAEIHRAADCVVGTHQRTWAEHAEMLGLLRDVMQQTGALVEDASWVQSQVALVNRELSGGVNRRALRDVRTVLQGASAHQQRIKRERDEARAAFRLMLDKVREHLESVGAQTDDFIAQVDGVSAAIGSATSLEAVADSVAQLLSQTRQMRERVVAGRDELSAAHSQVQALEDRVRTLEAELVSAGERVMTDHLTQIMNRRGLEQAFVQLSAQAGRSAASQERSLAVALLDVDNFKQLNDLLGHAAGDEALKHLAGTLRTAIRSMDQAARYGGEEFVVLMPDTSLEQAQQTMTRVQRQLTANYFLHDNRQVLITFSAGVTVWREGESLAEVIVRADTGMYAAKRSGKNRVVPVE